MAWVVTGVRLHAHEAWLVGPDEFDSVISFDLRTANESPFDGRTLDFALSIVENPPSDLVRISGSPSLSQSRTIPLSHPVSRMLFGPPHGSKEWPGWLAVIASLTTDRLEQGHA